MDPRPPTRPKRRRRLLAFVLAFGILAAALAGVVAARGPFFFMSCDPDALLERPIGRLSYVYAADGTLLTTLGKGPRHVPVSVDDVSPSMRTATVAIEDRRFFEHEGIDYVGVARALVRDVEAGEVVEGGSTITQQLARDLYLDRDRSFGRKLAEGCLAVELERRWSKERILAAYLNRVYYGRRAHGVEAAARAYFSKSARKLTLTEAALLAGLPQAPSRLDPLANEEGALARRAQVLEAMHETGAISEEELRRALRSPLGLQPARAFSADADPYVADFVFDRLVAAYGAEAVRRGGFRVRTTIDGRLQLAARKAIRQVLDRTDDPAAAIVAIDPRTGAVRALASVVPGRERYDFNLPVEGRRQAGSTFKPFVLAEAVRRGIDPWRTQYLSAPFEGPPSGGKPWNVETYDHTYVGRTTIADATLRSDNTVYARLTLDVGPKRVAETAAALGIESELEPVPSVGLGSGSVSVLELTSAYATLAAMGTRADPIVVDKVTLPDGSVDERTGWGKPRKQSVLPAPAAHHVTRVLERNIEAGTGTAAQIGRPAAGKTGTTDDFADAWFAGYTPDLAAAVWLGYPRGRVPMTDVHGITVSGGTFPAEIWARFMAAALEDVPPSGWPAVAETVAFERFCGRFQFARSVADARPSAGCPKPKPKPKRKQAKAKPATTESATTAKEATPPAPTTTKAPAPPPVPAPTTTQEQPPPPAPPPASKSPPPGLVGKRGVVTRDIPGEEKAGEVDVEGKLWPARSETGEPIPVDAEVEVVSTDERFVYVTPVGPEDG